MRYMSILMESFKVRMRGCKKKERGQMKKRVFLIIVSLLMMLSLIGCAASISTGMTTGSYKNDNVGKYDTVKNNLNEIVKIMAEETEAVQNFEIIGENSEMETEEDFNQAISAIEAFISVFEKNKDIIKGYQSTGISQIDMTYDAAIYYHDQMIQYGNNMKECFEILRSLIKAFTILANLDTADNSDNYGVTEMLLQALSDTKNCIEQEQYPDYIKSKTDMVVRELGYYESLAIEEYYAVELNDSLRDHAVNNMIGRVEKEIDIIIGDMMDILWKLIESPISEEINILETELDTNIAKLLNAL